MALQEVPGQVSLGANDFVAITLKFQKVLHVCVAFWREIEMVLHLFLEAYIKSTQNAINQEKLI